MKNCVLLLGYFDSIHLGHRKLISQAQSIAKKERLNVSLATFDDHFLHAIGRNEKEIFRLDERKSILSFLGINDIIVFPTSNDFLKLNKEQFCDYIYKEFSPKYIVVGQDYTFGEGGKGNSDYLQAYFYDKKIECRIVDIVAIEQQKVSSTYIKILLQNGEIRKANELLTQPFFISDKVVSNRKIGRTIGFPTANFEILDNKITPQSGVYATKTVINSMVYRSVTNIGSHPTFQDDNINIETHIIDYNGNLYGKKIKVLFYEKIRDIECFSTIEELQKKIKEDIRIAKEKVVL